MIRTATITTTSSAAIEARIVKMTRDFFVILVIPPDIGRLPTFAALPAKFRTVCSLFALSEYCGCPAAPHQASWSGLYLRRETPKRGRDSTAPLLRRSRGRPG